VRSVAAAAKWGTPLERCGLHWRGAWLVRCWPECVTVATGLRQWDRRDWSRVCCTHGVVWCSAVPEPGSGAPAEPRPFHNAAAGKAAAGTEIWRVASPAGIRATPHIHRCTAGPAVRALGGPRHGLQAPGPRPFAAPERAREETSRADDGAPSGPLRAMGVQHDDFVDSDFSCRICFEDCKPSEVISPCNCADGAARARRGAPTWRWGRVAPRTTSTVTITNHSGGQIKHGQIWFAQAAHIENTKESFQQQQQPAARRVPGRAHHAGAAHARPPTPNGTPFLAARGVWWRRPSQRCRPSTAPPPRTQPLPALAAAPSMQRPATVLTPTAIAHLQAPPRRPRTWLRQRER
jgi:hypothetical protein